LVNKKKLPVRWDDSAAQSLQGIFEIIKEESPIQAKRVKDALLLLARSLDDFPEKFSKEFYLADEPNNYRSVSKWSYKMVYEVTDDEIIIVMLFHGRQGQEVMERLKK
jgi:plasmid stabilization system protein ParE